MCGLQSPAYKIDRSPLNAAPNKTYSYCPIWTTMLLRMEKLIAKNVLLATTTTIVIQHCGLLHFKTDNSCLSLALASYSPNGQLT